MENLCVKCGHFLGLVSPVPDPEKATAPDSPEGGGFSGTEPRESPPPRPGPAGEPGLYLESLDTGQTYEIKNDAIVGQAHSSSRADVQLTGLPNLNYVSRHHCQFHLEAGIWYVTALSSSLNSTLVSQTPVSKGGRMRLRNGDELLMANVPFRVRIVAGSG
jgi:pSer/pThr/pTyr-binding forkhead associated (FHA) protein